VILNISTCCFLYILKCYMPFPCGNHISIYVLFQSEFPMKTTLGLCWLLWILWFRLCFSFMTTMFILLLVTNGICCLTEFGHGLWTLNYNWTFNIWFDCKPLKFLNLISSLTFTTYFIYLFCSSYGGFTQLTMDNEISVVC